MDKGTKRVLCGGFCCASLITIIVVLSLTFHKLDELDYGLAYNKMLCQFDGDPYTKSGLYTLGPTHEFITFPKTLQTIEFTAAEGDRLQTRTSDGLPVKLGISFQYRFDPARLLQLYHKFKRDTLVVYEKTARSTIANAATNYTAYTFFNEKAMIARAMEISLAAIYDEQLFAFVESFQITQVELPSAFQQAIVASITAKQNITKTQRYKENMKVTFEQQLLVANQTKLQTIALAKGQANRRQQEADALAAITRATVEAEMYSYGNLSQTVGLDEDGGLSYIWWDKQLQSAYQGKEYLVGLSPDTYIKADGQ